MPDALPFLQSAFFFTAPKASTLYKALGFLQLPQPILEISSSDHDAYYDGFAKSANLGAPGTVFHQLPAIALFVLDVARVKQVV